MQEYAVVSYGQAGGVTPIFYNQLPLPNGISGPYNQQIGFAAKFLPVPFLKRVRIVSLTLSSRVDRSHAQIPLPPPPTPDLILPWSWQRASWIDHLQEGSLCCRCYVRFLVSHESRA